VQLQHHSEQWTQQFSWKQWRPPASHPCPLQGGLGHHCGGCCLTACGLRQGGLGPRSSGGACTRRGARCLDARLALLPPCVRLLRAEGAEGPPQQHDARLEQLGDRPVQQQQRADAHHEALPEQCQERDRLEPVAPAVPATAEGGWVGVGANPPTAAASAAQSFGRSWAAGQVGDRGWGGAGTQRQALFDQAAPATTAIALLTRALPGPVLGGHDPIRSVLLVSMRGSRDGMPYAGGCGEGKETMHTNSGGGVGEVEGRTCTTRRLHYAAQAWCAQHMEGSAGSWQPVAPHTPAHGTAAAPLRPGSALSVVVAANRVTAVLARQRGRRCSPLHCRYNGHAYMKAGMQPERPRHAGMHVQMHHLEAICGHIPGAAAGTAPIGTSQHAAHRTVAHPAFTLAARDHHHHHHHAGRWQLQQPLAPDSCPTAMARPRGPHHLLVLRQAPRLHGVVAALWPAQ
jgi:hypothetical protein